MIIPFSLWTDILLNWLWRLTEESFWLHFLGDRLFNLLKRYFGNDVVLCGMLFYIIPLITAPFNNLVSTSTTKFYSYWYTTIKVNEKETAVFTALQSFIASQLGEKDFRNVEAKMLESPDANDFHEERTGPQQAPKLELFPSDKNHEFYYKGHKIWVYVGKETPSSFDNTDMGNGQLSDVLNMVNKVDVMSITMRTRQTSLLHGFMEEWIEIQHQKKYGKMTIYKSSTSRYFGSSWIQVGTKAMRSFDSVFLKSGQKETLLKDIQLFRQREKWYAKLGLPYRRGYLLRGPPGTGKTSLVQSIASKLNMNVAILSINNQMDDELYQYLLRTMPYNSILLIEDIDHCAGFKNKSGKGASEGSSNDVPGQPRLSMTGILNALDGVTAQEGSMIFMSCNNMDDIEPALLRPGRIDIKMELGYADQDQIRAMYHRFMDDDDNQLDNDDNADKKDQSLLMIKSPSSTSSVSTITSSTDTVLPDVDRFVRAIPAEYVTPAELQNFFICHLDAIQASPDPIQHIIDLVPGFLETVKADRLHAEKHQGIDKKQDTTMEQGEQKDNTSNQNNATPDQVKKPDEEAQQKQDGTTAG
ncbi:P-loop containing nucleoside triphosphate hydrolase protein [Chlamydoabsidia padenii]|nr:P-loop containing nucleoside triphosphate hydrolase protein [Chlamydoabsidia padenii]